MRCLLALMSCAAAAVAQEDEATLAAMKQLSTAVTSLQRAIDSHERGEMSAPLDELVAVVRDLPPTHFRDPTSAKAAFAAITAAAADLRQPVGDGAESDPWDLARIRGTCTHCHAQNRSGNEGRGWFPNRGGLVTGALRLADRDGKELTDRGGVVLFLEAPGLTTVPLPRTPSISQKGRRFEPAVLTVSPGTTVRFPNDDVVFHNVFSLSRGNAFDLGVYGKGIEKERVLTQPGLVKVHCNVHPEMAADVLVLPTPHTAISDTNGWWTIPDVPPGDYQLRIWHPLAAEQQTPVHVAADAATLVALEVRETKPRVPHPNKHGRPYDRNY